MNTNTGELMRMQVLDFYPEELKKSFTPVPDDLADEADKIIQNAEANGVTPFVDMNSNSALAKWAIDKRTAQKKAEKRRKRQKMAKQSRKRNR